MKLSKLLKALEIVRQNSIKKVDISDPEIRFFDTHGQIMDLSGDELVSMCSEIVSERRDNGFTVITPGVVYLPIKRSGYAENDND